MKPNDNMVMIVFVAAACLMACVGIIMDKNNKSIQKPIQKPFIIIEKNIQNWNYTGETDYTYSDANGNHTTFRDSSYKYNIGDTIK